MVTHKKPQEPTEIMVTNPKAKINLMVSRMEATRFLVVNIAEQLVKPFIKKKHRPFPQGNLPKA